MLDKITFALQTCAQKNVSVSWFRGFSSFFLHIKSGWSFGAPAGLGASQSTVLPSVSAVRHAPKLN